MERSTVHVAVLVVAEDPATVDLANATFLSDRATGAGHRIVAQEIVEDREAAIRDQLGRWISQPHIDIIIAAGADDATAAALAPLVTKPLPGLTDQLRLLARDRGSSSKPVAARCSSTFVFLLPPELAALGAALNQLILPQLDSTAERSLVGDMPRHRPAEAVPRVVEAEKTVTGPGVAPKIPAEPRGKRKTGANVIARREARMQEAAQDATRQIDRERLDEQIARSAGSHDAPTRPHIDLATMQPGASDRADTDEDLEDLDDSSSVLEAPPTPAVRTVQPARLRGPAPIATAKVAQPVPSAKPQPVATRPASVPALAKGPELPKPTPVSGVTTATPPAGNRMPSAGKPATAVATPAPVVATPAPVVATPAPVVARPAPAARPAAAVSQATVRPAAAVSQATARPIGESRRAELEAAAVEDAIDAASSADLIEAAEADFDEVSTPPTPSRVRAEPMIPVPRAPSSASPPMVPTRPATGPAPVVPTRPATGPAPVVATRPATGPAPVVPLLVSPDGGPPRPLIGAPELLDLRVGTQKTRRARTGTALVRKGKRPPILMYLALAAAAVAGFVAVVHFFPHGSDADDHVAMATTAPGSSAAIAPAGSSVPMTATPTPVGSAADPARPAGSAAPDVVGSAEIVATGSAEVAATAPPPTHATPSVPVTHHTSATSAPVTHTDTPKTEPAKPEPDKTAVAQPPVPPQPVADGCDEVSCVMDHYERACCAKFKPTDSGFHPRGAVPDSLDRSMVKTGIEKVKPKVIACGEKIATKGTVKLAITVAPAGTVQDISVADAPDAALGDCVLGAVKHAQFGQSVNGASFTYPFVF